MAPPQPGVAHRAGNFQSGLQTLDGYRSLLKVNIACCESQGLGYAAAQTGKQPDEQAVPKIGGRPLQQFHLADKELMTPIVAALQQHRLILLTHASEPVGHLYAGKGDCTPDVLYSLAVRFPELTIICAHWGGGLPFYALMPEVKKPLGQVYFDSAASPYL